MQPATHFDLLRLPRELCDYVYNLVLSFSLRSPTEAALPPNNVPEVAGHFPVENPTSPRVLVRCLPPITEPELWVYNSAFRTGEFHVPENVKVMRREPPILNTCRQIRAETLLLYYSKHAFHIGVSSEEYDRGCYAAWLDRIRKDGVAAVRHTVFSGTLKWYVAGTWVRDYLLRDRRQRSGTWGTMVDIAVRLRQNASDSGPLYHICLRPESASLLCAVGDETCRAASRGPTSDDKRAC